ncbi:hypothetical protein FRC07_011443 [Ceratobasidium sp. 392]|nr:hypothetical protein FRC07_011443 [Ceratobasidium sp. 392]
MSTKKRLRSANASPASQKGPKRVNIDMSSGSDFANSTGQASPERSRTNRGEADPETPQSYLEPAGVQIIVEDTKFLVHAHKIKKFAKLNQMLEKAKKEESLPQYEHPDLRGFAIQALEARQAELCPMRRITLSRTYDLPNWLPKAIEDLSEREQGITLEEANNLGAELFVDVSERREKAKYSKGWQNGRAGRQ